MLNIKPQTPYRVSQLNQEVRLLLEGHFKRIKVQGEISNLARPGSGHIYFSLKDNKSAIKCAFFKSKLIKSHLKPQDGMEVIVTANVSVYEARGEYQLIIDSIEESIEGRLQKAFEALKLKLHQAGLFDPALKKTIPKIPKTIGIISSPTGAALRDILITLKRRAPFIPIIIYPSDVQGVNAKNQLVNAIEIANKRQECDVLILARGGGSIEDLWPFNEEIVARSIFHSQLPIITGIGHETDTTIADFCASLRCPTPTSAAEHASESMVVLQGVINQYQKQLQNAINQYLNHIQHHCRYLAQRLSSPSAQIRQHYQKVDLYLIKLNHAIQKTLDTKSRLLQQKNQQLSAYNPLLELQNLKHRLQMAHHALLNQQQQLLEVKKRYFSKILSLLQAVSPLATLSRGYAIALNDKNEIIRDATGLSAGDRIMVRLKEQQLNCTLQGIENTKFL